MELPRVETRFGHVARAVGRQMVAVMIKPVKYQQRFLPCAKPVTSAHRHKELPRVETHGGLVARVAGRQTGVAMTQPVEHWPPGSVHVVATPFWVVLIAVIHA